MPSILDTITNGGPTPDPIKPAWVYGDPEPTTPEPIDTTRLLTSEVFLKFGALGQHLEAARDAYASIPQSNGVGQTHERLMELIRACTAAISAAQTLVRGNK